MNLIELLRHQNITFKETHFERDFFTVAEVAEYLNIDSAQIGKAMVIQDGGKNLIVLLISGSKRLDLDTTRHKLNDSKLKLVHSSKIETMIGLPVGAVTPLIKMINKEIRIIIDQKLMEFPFINISSGQNKIGIDINPMDLAKVTCATIFSF